MTAGQAAAERLKTEIDPREFDTPEYRKNPFPLYKRLRDHRPALPRRVPRALGAEPLRRHRQRLPGQRALRPRPLQTRRPLQVRPALRLRAQHPRVRQQPAAPLDAQHRRRPVRRQPIAGVPALHRDDRPRAPRLDRREGRRRHRPGASRIRARSSSSSSSATSSPCASSPTCSGWTAPTRTPSCVGTSASSRAWARASTTSTASTPATRSGTTSTPSSGSARRTPARISFPASSPPNSRASA